MHNNSAKMHNNKNGKQSLVSNGSPITIKPMANGYKNGHSNGHSNGYSHHIDDDFIKDVSQTDKCALHPCLVILASATINGIIFGVVNSFGVLYVYLIDKFKETNQYTDDLLDPLIAGVGSLCVGLIFLCSILASILTDRFGVRRICFIGGLLASIGMYMSSLSTNLMHLYLTYGVILGIGGSLAYAPSLVILGHYFKKRLGLANGLVTAGSSLFTIIMPILLKKFIISKGIHSTLAYLSILMSLLMICALTFQEKLTPQNDSKFNEINNIKKDSEKHKRRLFSRSLWHNKLYILWVFAIPIALFGYFVPFVHLVRYAKDQIPEANGEILVTCIGAFSGVGRFITGPIADVSNVNRIVLQQIAFLSIGILTMMLTVANSMPFLLIICCGLGLFDGCFISLLGPIAFDLVGPNDASQAIGFLLCFCSLPLTIGPPVAAYLYEINSNYTLAFILAGIPPIIGALLMIYLHKTQKSLRRNHIECLDQIDQFNQINQIKEFDEKSPVKIVNQNII